MNVNELASSNYLKKDDVLQPQLVTITGCAKENMAMEGQPVEMKLVVHFKEFEKGLACNITNARAIAAILNQDETDNWTGQQVVLYNDPTITYKGRVAGGIRVRASQRPQPAAVNPTVPQPPDEEIPF